MVSPVQTEAPKGFGWREVLIINAIGIVPSSILGAAGVTAVFALAGACLIGTYQPVVPEIRVHVLRQGLLAVGASAVAAVGLGLFFLPSTLGNLYVRRIARRCLDHKPPGQTSYVCQVSFTPRLHGGVRGFMEDADDVGHLWITDEALNFVGDHVRIALPLDSTKGVSVHSVGWRGLWVAGRRIRITANAVEGVSSLGFAERQSATVLSSRRISAEIIRELTEKIQRAGGDRAAGAGQ